MYAVPGTYTVKLVSTFNNCSDSAMHTVTVLPGPSSSFTATPLAGCSVPFTTTFSNASTGATSFVWLFGDGTTSTAPNPSHTYTAYGSYTVKLVSTSANGCTDTLTRPAYVSIAPPFGFILTTPTGGCAPITIHFDALINSLVPIATYAWNFGDGTTGTGISVSHTYTTTGVYTITLVYTTTSGCVNTVTASVTVATKPVSAFSATPTTVCVGQAVQFTNNTTGANSYTWLFGDGQTSTQQAPAHIYGAPGVYTVTLVSSNNFSCNDTLVIQNLITVNPPLANFTVNSACGNQLTYSFINTSIGGTSYLWNFGDGTTSTAFSPSHTYAANGVYTVTLTVTSSVTGCTNTYALLLYAQPLAAQFTAADTTLCSNVAAVFTPVGSSNIFAYTWNFGDGTIVGLSTPSPVSHFYSPGIYTVKLVVTNQYGCKDSLVRVSYIRVGTPVASFTGTPTSGCAPLAVNFVSTAIASPAFPLTSYAWDFGDGSPTGTGPNPSHTYMAQGNYPVTMAVTDANGCTSIISYSNYIHASKPAAAFTASDTLACVNQTISFFNTSASFTPLTSSWTFGDGGASAAANPTHTYAATGNYTVRLIVTDANGCKDTLTRTAYIHITNVQAHFTMSDSTANCPPLTVNFTNTSISATSYFWTFGNGSTSTQIDPTAVFSTPGTFTVTLKAFAGSGCVDSFSKTVTISGGPSGTLSYGPISGCAPLVVTFTATAVNTTTKTFDFNNGVTQATAGNSIIYTYTTPGVYVPKLVLSNGVGCNTAITGIDTIKIEKVKAGFSAAPNPVCVGTAVQFTDTSSTVISPVTTRSWTFGDGGTSAATNPTHTYGTAGTYTVRLIASTANGCPDTTTRTLVVNPLPVITAANATICAGSSVQLTVSGAGTYLWSPATGLSCINCANPVANPTATTTYTITGTSAAGCMNTGSVTVTVNPLPVVGAGPNQSICGGGLCNPYCERRCKLCVESCYRAEQHYRRYCYGIACRYHYLHCYRQYSCGLLIYSHRNCERRCEPCGDRYPVAVCLCRRFRSADGQRCQQLQLDAIYRAFLQ